MCSEMLAYVCVLDVSWQWSVRSLVGEQQSGKEQFLTAVRMKTSSYVTASLYTSGIVIHESCGTRQSVVGLSVSVADGSFTSQLLVNASEELSGKIIESANESGEIIGSKEINTSSGKQTH